MVTAAQSDTTPRFVELGAVSEQRSLPDIEFRSNQGVSKKREQTKIFKLTQASDPVQVKTIIGGAYRQVFERDIEPYIITNEFTVLETKLANNEINLKEFIEALGGSQLYIKEFYAPYPNTKVIELGTKHFLGRAPLDQSEIRKYNQILASEGLKAFIGAMVNSAEYGYAFGEDTVPYNRFLTLPAANYPNTQTLYNKLTKQDAHLVVPSFDTIKPKMDGSKLPLMGKALADNAAKAASLTAVGRSSSHGVETVQRKSARMFRLTADMSMVEKTQVMYAAYVQIMDVNGQIPEELRRLDLDAQLLNGTISVREFVCALASSDVYARRFYTPYPNPKAIELLCLHLLGRMPIGQEEMSQYIEILNSQGLSATVKAMVDSTEYDRFFGEDVVPYNR
jgi:phycobilisome core-membrane linker protein